MTRGWLGISIQDVDPALASALGLPNADGVLASDVEPGSPAAKGGFQRGDVVLRFNGEKVDSASKLKNLVAAAGTDKRVKVDVLRAGQPKTLEVVLGTLQSKDVVKAGSKAEQEQQRQSLDGVTAESLTPELRNRLRLSERVTQGIVVTRVAPGSNADEAGLRPGDVIFEVNRQPVTSVESFGRLYSLHKKDAKKGTLLLVHSNGGSRYIVVKP